MGTKYCSGCNRYLTLDKFHKRSDAKIGVKSRCKDCRNKEHSNKNHKDGLFKPLGENKETALYLGYYIAENVLSNIFKDVKRMGINNSGFDFVCNKGYKIDVKASVLHKNKYKNPYWQFGIRQNNIPDYFLLIAFDNRENLNPLHVWLVPKDKICHLKGLSLSLKRIDEWKQYELEDKLEKVITCCNKIKSGEEALC